MKIADLLWIAALLLGLVLTLLHRVLPTRTVAAGSALVLGMLSGYTALGGNVFATVVCVAVALFILAAAFRGQLSARFGRQR